MKSVGSGSVDAASVEVLLSTYNPGPYLVELLESLRKQTYPNVTLSVRDDGSHLDSRRFVERLLAGQGDVRFTTGTNMGPTQSFLALLREVRPSTAYAAFCDQDDVWASDKLSVAVASLADIEGPALYCSAVQLVTSTLEPIRVHRRGTRGPAFANALVENIATGCTVVLNRPAVDLLASRSPDRAVMHDAWSYLVLAGCGTVVYDPQPHVLYRLHERNAVGVSRTLPVELLRRVRRQLRSGGDRLLTAQARELQSLYGSALSPDAAADLAAFLDAQERFGTRVRYALGGSAFRQRTLDDLIFRLLYVARRL